ncbi:glycosyl hydrolase [Coniella lustricola]|uniref:Glycosyl hydrolase n=1 Tax=Coniella lustricola TaxID=2025994 RepID=A0A2T2ZVK8_9PEZI|nr:glycosyl hydrolase [Coniella lustricola]
MDKSQIKHGMAKSFDYGTSVVYKGFQRAIAQTHNHTYLDFYLDQMSIVQDNGTITDYNYTFYSLDQYRIGMPLLYLYTHTTDTSSSSTSSPIILNNSISKYGQAATLIRNMLDLHPRNPQGGFWHRSPTYPDQIWGDSIFMGTSFYAQYTSVFEPWNASAWDDVTLQHTLYYTHSLTAQNHNTTTIDNGDVVDANDRLLKHGYDASKRAIWASPVTGASPLVWVRAVGWFFSSLLETIEVMPASHPGHATLTGYFQSLAEGLLEAQDNDTAGWWLIMDEQYVGVEGNYIESSATAMFTNGFLQGVRLGILDGERFLGPAKRAYRMMVEEWVVVDERDGTLNWEGTVSVGSLGGNATFEYYSSQVVDENDDKGIGAFMWASYEYELLQG